MIQIQAIVLKKNENVQQKIFSKRNRKHFENNKNVIRTKQNAHKKKLFRNKYSIKIF